MYLNLQGSVFVEFAEKPMADGFLGLPTIKFNDTELIKESKSVVYTLIVAVKIMYSLSLYREAYFLRKQHERKQAKQEQKAM